MTLNELAEKVWAAVYPERRKWEDLEQSTRDEWIRFVEISQELILTEYIEISNILGQNLTKEEK